MTPDGGQVYAVTRSEQANVHHGWITHDAVHLLTSSEAAAVPDEVRLSIQEVLKHTTIVSVHEDWQDIYEPATLALRTGEILQISMFKAGWAFGWPLEYPTQRGWFPLAYVQHIGSQVSALAPHPEHELSSSATAALVELIKEAPKPPPSQWDLEGDLPPIVAESVAHSEREWQERFAQMDSEAAAPQDTVDDTSGLAGDIEDTVGQLFAEEPLPDDCYPLMVCTKEFTPPKGTSGALLQVHVGDLIRVTSAMDAAMCYGFLDNRPATRGWFPKKFVRRLEDPLDVSNDSLPAHIGAPPLPQIPAWLIRKGDA